MVDEDIDLKDFAFFGSFTPVQARSAVSHWSDKGVSDWKRSGDNISKVLDDRQHASHYIF